MVYFSSSFYQSRLKRISFQVWTLKKTFDQFSKDPEETISIDNIHTIYRVMNIKVTVRNLEQCLRQLGLGDDGEIDFQDFVEITSKFILVEDEETTRYELKEAFR